MSSAHDAFLQAIREAPEDDTPRLVYSDWLDEHGDPARACTRRSRPPVSGAA